MDQFIIGQQLCSVRPWGSAYRTGLSAQSKIANILAGELKAVLGGADVENTGPGPELVGFPSATASVSAAPLIQKIQNTMKL